MCGIAGLISSTDPALHDAAERVGRACAAMHTRGPDDEGVFVSDDRRVALGNRRLAIRDLTPAGHMPMRSRAGNLWITYNGEMYNAAEIRRDLDGLGYSFRSTGDTELVLYGYEAWAEGIFSRMRGMFAVAIYDTRSEPYLLLARDPLGIKPLYYAEGSGCFGFASTCKALLALGIASAEISPPGLAAYLQLGSVPAPLTIYRDIRAVESGHIMTVEISGARPRARRPRAYWQLPNMDAIDRRSLSRDAAVELTHSLLLDSVDRHLVSDVPLGVFLSGGVDSASLVALMREANPNSVIRTCSVVFAEGQFDESAHARVVAEKFETQHVEIPISAADVARELEDAVGALDQPSNDGVNVYFVSQAARQSGLTVALSGLGGDELFGGYPSFRQLGQVYRFGSIVGRIPGGTTALSASLRSIAPYHPYERAAEWLHRVGTDAAPVYLGVRGMFSPSQVERLLRPDVLEREQNEFDLVDLVRRSSRLHPGFSEAEVVSRLELTCYMRHQLLRDTDAMSMAHSIEVRVPFVDHVVLEQAIKHRLALFGRSQSKQLLRDAVPSLPDASRNRRGKQGFTLPLGQWMRSQLRAEVRDLVATVERGLRDYLEPRAINELFDAFEQGKVHWSRPWALAALSTALTVPSVQTRVVQSPLTIP